MIAGKVRVTLTIEEALIAADLLAICRARLPYPGLDTDERWQIAGQLALRQRERIERAMAKLRAAVARSTR